MTSPHFDLLLRGGTIVNKDGRAVADVGISNGKIAAVGTPSSSTADRILDVRGLHILPGVIDTQVHFREPGLEAKEDLETGTRAALLGGVTGIFEMPNTKPPTTTRELLDDKFRRAKDRAWVNYAFYVGASPENAETLRELEMTPGCAGVKVFMGSSTGSLLVADDPTLERVLSSGRRRVAVHAEDEDRLKARKAVIPPGGGPYWHPIWRDVECALTATKRLIAIARKTGRRVHVLHVTTGEELDFLRGAKDIATVEAPPQHLTFSSPECYERLGTYAQMNPPIREARHRELLWRGIDDGTIDVLGSDHAPHTRAEKDARYPDTPSGMPGVQTYICVMLDHVAAGRLSLERFVDLSSAGPARVFSIKNKGRVAVGFDADLSIVDLGAKFTVDNSWIASRCGWSPYHGMSFRGRAVSSVINGVVALCDGAAAAPALGRPISFDLPEGK